MFCFFIPLSQYFEYDEANHRATLQDNPHNAHEASYSNASRVTTYLRPGVEQFHGAIKGTYKVIKMHKIVH